MNDKYGNPIDIGDWVCFIKSSGEDCARSPWATGPTPKIEVGKITEWVDANGRMKLCYKSNGTFPQGSWNSEFAFANDVVKAYQGYN
jgi:hypothetical protein